MPKAEPSTMQVSLNRRFFVAMDALIAHGSVKSLSGFANECGLHAPRYREMRNVYGTAPTGRGSRYIAVETEALYYLVTEYNVSADWLLTGRGQMFTP